MLLAARICFEAWLIIYSPGICQRSGASVAIQIKLKGGVVRVDKVQAHFLRLAPSRRHSCMRYDAKLATLGAYCLAVFCNPSPNGWVQCT